MNLILRQLILALKLVRLHLFFACRAPLFGRFSLYLVPRRLNCIKVRWVAWPKETYDGIEAKNLILIPRSVGWSFILLDHGLWPLYYTLHRKWDKKRYKNRLLVPLPINTSMALLPHISSISLIMPPLSRLATNSPAMASVISLPFNLLFELPSSPIFVLLKGI
jgi:hypothetical protein